MTSQPAENLDGNCTLQIRTKKKIKLLFDELCRLEKRSKLGDELEFLVEDRFRQLGVEVQKKIAAILEEQKQKRRRAS